MSYMDIFVIGWNANSIMILLNLFVAMRLVSTTDSIKLQEESRVLDELKQKLDKYYPYKTYETIATYLLPFVAFYRISFRFIEMYMFFQKNKDARMFDFMVYKYSMQIQEAENR